MKSKIPLNIVRLSQCPILTQLHWEEALLRLEKGNWCVINEGSSPAIVLGISNRPALAVNALRWRQKPIPLIRRFTGGGTVVVDEQTYFVSFICDSQILQTPSYPHEVFAWAAEFYRRAFYPCSLALIENDFTWQGKKCGGNAQYMAKNRWLHHTSFLWDFHAHHMEYLLMPPKAPSYRQNRKHEEFLCRLKEIFPSKSIFQNQLLGALEETFSLCFRAKEEVEEIARRAYRQTTCQLSQEALEK